MFIPLFHFSTPGREWIRLKKLTRFSIFCFFLTPPEKTGKNDVGLQINGKGKNGSFLSLPRKIEQNAKKEELEKTTKMEDTDALCSFFQFFHPWKKWKKTDVFLPPLSQKKTWKNWHVFSFFSTPGKKWQKLARFLNFFHPSTPFKKWNKLTYFFHFSTPWKIWKIVGLPRVGPSP